MVIWCLTFQTGILIQYWLFGNLGCPPIFWSKSLKYNIRILWSYNSWRIPWSPEWLHTKVRILIRILEEFYTIPWSSSSLKNPYSSDFIRILLEEFHSHLNGWILRLEFWSESLNNFIKILWSSNSEKKSIFSRFYENSAVI